MWPINLAAAAMCAVAAVQAYRAKEWLMLGIGVLAVGVNIVVVVARLTGFLR